MRAAAPPLAAAILAGMAVAAPTSVAIEGRRLLVDGVPVHLKGVNWNPVPLGNVHPHGLDYSGSVAVDSALMQQAGINALRSYECICDVEVLDALWNRSIFVLNTVFANANEPLSLVEEKVNAVKHHPAVLMWVVGNEWNYNSCYASHLNHAECLAYIRDAARLVKQHDRAHPVASVYGSLPSSETLRELSVIDVWGANFYYGLGFHDEELGGSGDLFEEWARRSGKPLFIGEYGADAWDTRNNRTDYAAQAEALSSLTGAIVNQSSVLEGGVCLGGMVFEFADEWWKDWTGNATTHDDTGFDWGHGPHPDFRFNEEWWGLLDIHRSPRPAYYAYANITAPAFSPGPAPGAGRPGLRR